MESVVNEPDKSNVSSRWRLRFSLFSALLLMTIAGMAIVIAQLWHEIGPLRKEVRRLAKRSRATFDR